VGPFSFLPAEGADEIQKDVLFTAELMELR
jgi:hypothetical protein